MAIALPYGGVRILTERRVSLRRNQHARPSSRTVCFDGFVDRFLVAVGRSGRTPSVRPALLHGPEQFADLPVPVAESPGAVRIGHPECGHLVEYLAPNSVFNGASAIKCGYAARGI